jgi:hypothetical protein
MVAQPLGQFQHSRGMGARPLQVAQVGHSIHGQAVSLHFSVRGINAAGQFNSPPTLLQAVVKAKVESVYPGGAGQGLHFQGRITPLASNSQGLFQGFLSAGVVASFCQAHKHTIAGQETPRLVGIWRGQFQGAADKRGHCQVLPHRRVEKAFGHCYCPFYILGGIIVVEGADQAVHRLPKAMSG